jgi:hypothetical protein
MPSSTRSLSREPSLAVSCLLVVVHESQSDLTLHQDTECSDLSKNLDETSPHQSFTGMMRRLAEDPSFQGYEGVGFLGYTGSVDGEETSETQTTWESGSEDPEENTEGATVVKKFNAR